MQQWQHKPGAVGHDQAPRRRCNSFLEPLQTIAKYAPATQARICVQVHDGTLRFTVSDDAMGHDARHTPMGSGQRNMADRLATLGGWLEVRSAMSQGITMTGYLPVPLLDGSWDGLVRCATSVARKFAELKRRYETQLTERDRV